MKGSVQKTNLSNTKHIAIALFSLYVFFSLWVYTGGTSLKSGFPGMNSEALSGKNLYQEFNCVSCHQIFGLGGYLGPDLTHVMSQPGKGPVYVAAFLRYGTKQMPDYHMDSIQISHMISFLSFVDSSATAEIKFYRKKL